MAMSEASVAGVAVDTRHWIGGRRVASPATFTDLSPIDEQPVGEVARGGAAEVEQEDSPPTVPPGAPPAQPKQSAGRRASSATHREGGKGMGQRG